MLDQLFRKARKRGAHFEELSPQERHKLRILLKRLRYTLDFFLPLLGTGRKMRDCASTLARLQEELGRANDRAVAERLIWRIADRDTIAPEASAALLDWLAEDAAESEAQLLRAWKSFRSKVP